MEYVVLWNGKFSIHIIYFFHFLHLAVKYKSYKKSNMKLKNTLSFTINPIVFHFHLMIVRFIIIFPISFVIILNAFLLQMVCDNRFSGLLYDARGNQIEVDAVQ